MSTDLQQYSIANQSAAIALYAAAHNIGIIRSFVDEGKSGTTIKKRKGLQELLRVVQSGEADFDQILVYDVSRWGRFPDSDESAHYEYLCKQAGITVHYCAEQFDNDNSTASNLLKALKRTMAGEFSRELSARLSQGMRRLASMGYWQGGYPAFGMTRLLIGANGEAKQILKYGEWQSLSTDRTVLVPGDPREVKTVKLAFDLYTKQRKTRRQIAQILNERSMLPPNGQHWTMVKLLRLFRDHVYKGAYAYGKYAKGRLLPREKWSIRERTFRGIVSEKQWEEANARIREELKPYLDSELLDTLRRLLKRSGRLTQDIINNAKTVPSAEAYRHHFGSLNETYKLIGYPTRRESSYVHVIGMTRQMRDKLCDEICGQVRATGGTAERKFGPGILLINGAITVQVTFSTGRTRTEPYMEWVLDLKKSLRTDVLVIARLCPPNQSILDYFILPAFAGFNGRPHVRKELNAPYFDLYHFRDLRPFVESFRSSPLWEVQESNAAGAA
jgi:DNA invertase Pin-like site-specific DNA recombinase